MREIGPTSAAPAEPGWDIAFTRISREVAPHVDVWISELRTRFKSIGLAVHAQVRQTPRGLSTFVAVVGRHGLLLIVDATLIDGMAVGRRPGVSLDVRLLDAFGDVVAQCQAPFLLPSAGETIPREVLARSATSVCVMAMGHFDLISAREHDCGL